MINNFFKKKLDSDRFLLLPDDVKEKLISDFNLMSSLGIENEDDQRKFYYISLHTPRIIKDLFKNQIPHHMYGKIIEEVYSNRENKPVNSLLALMEAIDGAIKKMLPERMKLAYPQGEPILNQRPTYNLEKWVGATRDIYALISKGNKEKEAFEEVTKNWQEREKMNYEKWLNFYRERVPEKYTKMANLFVTPNGISFDGINYDSLKSKIPNPISVTNTPGHPKDVHDTDDKSDQNDVRERIDRQRTKIIGRLRSAEKLLESNDGQLFAGDDLELMLRLLQDLKRKVQTATKRTVKSSLFDDYIIRTANYLSSLGKEQAADFFIKVAGPPGMPEIPSPLTGPLPGPNDPVGGSSGGDGTGDKNDTEELLKEFFDNLSRGVQDPDNEARERNRIFEDKKRPPHGHGRYSAGKLDVRPPHGQGRYSKKKADEEFELVVEAQEAIPAQEVAPAKAPIPAPEAIPEPVSEAPAVEGAIEDIEPSAPKVVEDKTDDVIDAALKNISIGDVVKRLEMLVSIYNQREISRQLSILDIMMDRVGLASFFPSLGEAMAKALEANQYIGSRLEDVLTKVKGSMQIPGADQWTEIKQDTAPETMAIRQNLENQEAEEQKRKDLRKQKELSRLEGKEPAAAPAAPPPPSIEPQELERPARVETTPPIQTR
jgi:hypothetical protein